MAVVGLQQMTYQVDEDAGAVEVCFEVNTTTQQCIIPFPFLVTLTTVDGTGIYVENTVHCIGGTMHGLELYTVEPL